jgi:hypothetical protein
MIFSPLIAGRGRYSQCFGNDAIYAFEDGRIVEAQYVIAESSKKTCYRQLI